MILSKYSFKVLNFVEHCKFKKKNKYLSPITHQIDGKFCLFSNIEQVKKYIITNHLNQSCVLYKLDNDKIENLKFCDKNKIFLTNVIFYKDVILQKKIFFDVNRPNDYFYYLQNLHKYL